ncbi:MAG: sulfurtransferase TusA family protein [Paracoccaceae bacterium]
MTEPTDPESDLDARGLLCPLPVLKLRKRLAALAPGAAIRMTADDPAARVDVPHFCTEQGHALLEATDGPDGTLVFRVRKGG